MLAIKLLLVLLLFFSTSLLTNGQQSECIRTVATMETYEYYVQGAYRSEYNCGFWGWSRCYRTRYTSHLKYGSRLAYHQEPVCCSGYLRVGGECILSCPNCPESHSCLAPYFCACPENWSGEGCTEPPQNVALTATGPDTLRFRWSPPPDLVVTLYVVIFQDETHHVDPSSDLVMDLDSLNTYTAYTCCVAANTTSGPSRIACATQRTLQRAPGDAPRNFILRTLNSTAIHIQWGPPLTPNGIIIHYTIYINNGNPPLNVDATSAGLQHVSVGGFSPDQSVTVRLSASTTAGEGPKTASQSVTTDEAVPGRVENLNVIAVDANTFDVSWGPPTSPNGELTGYTVLVKNLMNTTETPFMIESHLNQLRVDGGIGPYVRYSVLVAASTAVGLGIPVEKTLYSQEGSPQSPPPNVNSTRKSATNASVEWDGIRWEDLRGWLVDYEIGYGRVMMSVHQQCPANDSTYTETLSVDSEGEYELTSLDPGLQYCMRLAGRTSAGAGPFSHTLIPWHTNSVFTVKLQMSYCIEWIAVKPAEIVEDLSRAFGSGIELTCNCTFTSDYIADGQLTCRNDILIFQGRIISTTDRNSTDLLTNFETWLSTDPTIMARGKELKLFKNERFTESENRNQSIVGATAGVAAVLILLVALVIVLILWRINRRKLSMAVGCRLASATSLNSIAADYEEPLKTVFSKPPMKDRKPIPAPNTFPKPLKVTPKPLELSPRQQKPPLQPPPKNPSISREKANKHALKEQKTSLIDCEMPIAGTENVYDDPDNITSGAKDGIASFPNIAYNRPSTKEVKSSSGTQK